MSYKIIGQYIKKLDFRIPNPKSFSLLSKNIANYKINIDIKSNQLKETMIEIETSLSLKPTKEDSDKIETRIIYSAIIELTDNIKEKSKIEKIILVDVPTDIYPNLRKIFIFVFENSGFKDIKINEKVDFQKLYNSKKNQ
jgi:preprotein translocase subunit SecB